jgi:Ca2+-dependent lipid-binding protein
MLADNLSSIKVLLSMQILRAEKLRGGSSGRSAASSSSPSSVVHVVLVQALGLTAMDKGDSSDPYCKLSLGRDKARSKVINGTLNPKWREAFDLFWHDEEEEHVLEITVWDKDIGAKDDFMGRSGGRYNIKSLDCVDKRISRLKGKWNTTTAKHQLYLVLFVCKEN